ncbi:MAG: helix-turn-helix transcriptional regulator [Motiliproteus sp.]
MDKQPITQPTPDEIKDAIKEAGLSRTEAAELMHTTKHTLNKWTLPDDSKTHRPINLGAWELLLLKLGQHPFYELKEKV